jgi:hypothetical protein
MENLLIAVVVLLTIIVVGLLVIVSFFLYKYLKLKEDSLNSEKENSKYTPEIQNLLADLKSQKEPTSDQFCVDHPELSAKGTCSISEEAYCELCLSKEGEIRLARKNLALYLDFEWEDCHIISDVEAGADTLNHLIKTKKDLWKFSEIPIITQKQFKINIENDKIEAYTVIKSRVKDQALVGSKLSFLKS